MTQIQIIELSYNKDIAEQKALKWLREHPGYQLLNILWIPKENFGTYEAVFIKQ